MTQVKAYKCRTCQLEDMECQRIWGKDSPAELLHLAMTEFLRTGSLYDWACQAAFRFEADRTFPRIQCPTLFLVTEGDLLRSKNERSVELTPNAEGRVIENPYGQFPARDPEGFSGEIPDLLTCVTYLT